MGTITSSNEGSRSGTTTTGSVTSSLYGKMQSLTDIISGKKAS